MTNAQELSKQYGQSIWLDYIRRSFVRSGGLKDMVEQGIRGVTSNPSIFEKAIAGSDDYDEAMQPLVNAGKSIEEIYDALTIEDIAEAADVLRPVYDSSNGADGFVSLEVSPTLANDTEKTISEARRLFKAVGRPNVMIKVPGTPAGVPAIETLTADGININVTLLFSLSQYEAIANAYIKGLEKFQANGGDLSKVSSVASFFVSRVDGKTDAALEAKGNKALQGKIAIANAKVAYARFEELFSSKRWEKLAAFDANVQRPLWASTSTKNPEYPDTLYVDTLIGPHTVNTVPQETLDALQDHVTLARTIDQDVEEARQQIAQLAELGIDFDAITEDLQEDGVKKFAQSFETLMAGITEKCSKLKDSSYAG